MTKKPEEDNTAERSEDAPPIAEEPSRADPPTGDTPTAAEEPTKTDGETVDPPTTVEEPIRTAEEVEAGGDGSGTNTQDDVLDKEPSKADMEGDGVVADSKMQNGGTAVAEVNASGDQTVDGTDGGDAVPESEQEKALDAPEAESGTPAADEAPAAGNDDTDAAPAGEPAAAVNSQEPGDEPASEDTPPESKDTPPESKDTPPEVQDTPTEAQDTPTDGGDGEPAPADTDTATAVGEDGGDKPEGGDVTDSVIPAPEATNDEAAAGAGEAAESRLVTRVDDYDDDFSEMSEKSDQRALTSVPVVTLENDAGQDASEEAAAEGSPQVAGQSPTPSSKDEARAEAGAVVPVPVPLKRSDGRSLVEERGEIRGEDRSEVQGDGGEDSRGQGQWKSEEELFLESSLMNQHAEKEALQKIIDEKVRLQKEYDALKGRYLALEEDSQRWHLEVGVLKEKCQQQEQRIKELEAEEARLREFEQWGKDNEAKVVDLQTRLATLATEDAEKDRRIQKLQEDLQETKSRLTVAERQAAARSSETAAQQPPPQQSKTCTIM